MTTREERICENLRAAGHVLKVDEEGFVDRFVVDFDFHTGPGCVRCGGTWCLGCERTSKAFTPCSNPLPQASATE